MLVMSITKVGLALCASLLTPAEHYITSCRDDPERVSDFLFSEWMRKYSMDSVVWCATDAQGRRIVCRRDTDGQECIEPLTYRNEGVPDHDRGVYLFCKPAAMS